MKGAGKVEKEKHGKNGDLGRRIQSNAFEKALGFKVNTVPKRVGVIGHWWRTGNRQNRRWADDGASLLSLMQS